MPFKVRISRNPGPVRVGCAGFVGHRWKHETLPQRGSRRKLHLWWLGPVFILSVPKMKEV